MQTIILFTISLIAVCSATIPFTSDDPNVLARIYDNYTQLYRPATLKVPVNNSETLGLYRFYFTKDEFENIDTDSFILLNINVVERTIVYHPNPNIETVGTRYLYQPNLQYNSTIEIELIDTKKRLFRNVEQPKQYFYLKSFDNLIYLNDIPNEPYYEILYLTNQTNTEKLPLLSYIDQSISYTPRYFVNLPSLNNDEQAEFIAYADITNNETYPIIFKAVELIVKHSNTNEESYDYLRNNLSEYTNNSTNDNIENENSTYVYQLTSPIPIILPPYSIKSVQFIESNLSVVPFLSLSTIFSPMNITGNVIKSYNLTSLQNYIPSGQMIYHDQGRFVGELILPELNQNETFFLSTDTDFDVNYRRQVRFVPSNETNDDSLTYEVEFTFENNKQFDVPIDFTESFYPFKNYQIENISADLIIVDDGIEGDFIVPKQDKLTVSYRVTLQK